MRSVFYKGPLVSIAPEIVELLTVLNSKIFKQDKISVLRKCKRIAVKQFVALHYHLY